MLEPCFQSRVATSSPLCAFDCGDPNQSFSYKASLFIWLSLLNRANLFCLQCTRKKEICVSVAEWIHPSIFICFRAELAVDSHKRGDWQLKHF